MPQRDGDRRRGKDGDGLIWAREDVVVTSALHPQSGHRSYFVKVTETDEIFELGEVEYQIWKAFEGGLSLAAAERELAARLDGESSKKLRGLVAELALRGLLQGDIPDELFEEFAEDPRVRRLQLRYPIEPDGGDPARPYFRFLLFDPNPPFAALARWFGFLRHLRWPIVIAAVLACLVLIKHSYELGVDFPPTILYANGIPHCLFTLLTINLVRTLVMGSVIRHYGARMRFFSIDLRFGIWPRFHVDKRGMMLLKRTPQLWSHSSPFFVRLGFFGFGTLGWWWFRGNGSILSPFCLLLSQAGLIDLAISAQPFFKNETYAWICAYFEEPYLNERAVAALRSVFLGKASPFDLPPIEKAALTAYGVSVVFCLMLVAYFVVTLFMGYTGKYRGVGLSLFLMLCLLFSFWIMARRNRKKRTQAIRVARRAQRRLVRSGAGGAPEFAPLIEE